MRHLEPDLPLDLLQVVLLLTSEVVSNAVRHGGTRLVAIRCEAVPHHVRVEVFDEGSCFVPRPRSPDRNSAGGWGLQLVDELSSRWGVADSRGARVWFEVDR